MCGYIIERSQDILGSVIPE